jgi:prophage antirepressor-like protein
VNELKIFNNDEFGQVRAIVINNKEYFYGVDIATALGYERPSKAVSDHCKGILIQDTIKNSGGYPEKLIPEGDVYRLVSRSQLPTAEKFEAWVFDEVLPSIRKHGAYVTDNVMDQILSNPEFGIKLLTELKNERNLRKQVEESKKIIEEENRILSQETVKWADRKLIEALVKKLGYKIGYSEAWTSFKKELLYKHSININLRITNYMNSTGKKTQPKTLSMIHDEELQACLSTAVAICKTNNVDISEIIKKFKTA